MANKSLTDLTARTATADTDLIHVNSGGTDYKETKFNFLEGGFHYVFNNTSTITSQADALGDYACVFGTVSNSSSAQATLGLPLATSGRIEVRSYNANYKKIWYYPNGNTQAVYTLIKSGGTWASTWTQEPTRDEITSLNSSLSNTSLKYSDHTYTGTFTPNSSGYVKLGSIPTDFGVSINNYFVGFLIRGWSGGQGALTLAIGSNGTDLYLLSSSTTSVTSINIRMWYVPTAST